LPSDLGSPIQLYSHFEHYRGTFLTVVCLSLQEPKARHGRFRSLHRPEHAFLDWSTAQICSARRSSMNAPIEPNDKPGRRSLSADLNLVPYIDLLTCMVAFLLITAVWAQLAQLKTSQRSPGSGEDETPPGPKIEVLVEPDTINVVIDNERQVLPDKNGQPDNDGLGALLKKAKGQFPDKDDVQIASTDAVLFERLTDVMDRTIAAGFPSVSLLPTRDHEL
jgi:biopolymer transport protein ExbD